VRLPLLKDPPPFLADLLNPNGDTFSKYFIKSIRSYNSMFAFTSLGAKIDMDINKGPSPYVFKINGQVHHQIGSLLPDEGKSPVYAQLYIYDTDNEVENRISIFDRDRDCEGENEIDRRIVEGLVRMFDAANELVKSFRQLGTYWSKTIVAANYVSGYCTIDRKLHLSTMHQQDPR